MATDFDQKLDPSQSYDINIQWEDVDPVLQTTIKSTHNKAKGIQVHTTNISNQNNIPESKKNYHDEPIYEGASAKITAASTAVAITSASIGSTITPAAVGAAITSTASASVGAVITSTPVGTVVAAASAVGAEITSSSVGAYAISVFSTYVIDLSISQAVLETISAQIGYAAGVGAWGGLVGIGIGATGVLAQAGYKYYQRQVENNKLKTKKMHNSKVTLINQKSKELKMQESKVKQLKKNLENQEAILNNYTFRIERFDRKNCKVIVAIGPTGYGKSLFCNRMMGNKDDIGSIIEDAVDPDYIVADFGSTASQTTDLKKVIKKIHIEYDNNTKSSFKLSVVDTPGGFDSNGNDIHFQNKMAEYFRACGGINMFCIFFKLGSKIDGNYKRLLKSYEIFWGKEMWKHCVIVITNCDMDSKRLKKQTEKGLPKTVKGVQEYLNKVSNGLCNNVPIYQFGEDNYEESTKNLLLSLIDQSSVFDKKYSCKNITAPINTLWTELESALSDFLLLTKEIRLLKTEIDKLKKELQ